MLKQRVITALVLLAVLLPAAFATATWPFGLVSLMLIGAAGWEWSRLNGAPGGRAVAAGLLLLAACGVGFWLGVPAHVPSVVWWCATAVWVLGGSVSLRVGVSGWPHLSQSARLLLGWVLLGISWLAISAAKMQGVDFLLSVFVIVWTADMAAYFGGRTWGRRKLALTISPGKSWEGAYTGVAAVVAVAIAWVWLEPSANVEHSFYFLIWQRFGGGVLVLVALFLAVLSVMGDLLESLVKRSAGVKDSSGLLPGHGGVLDRIDALLPVFPAAMALASL